MIDGLNNANGRDAYSQKEEFFESLEGKKRIPKENFFEPLEGKEQIKNEKWLKENSFKSKDFFDKSSSNVKNSLKNLNNAHSPIDKFKAQHTSKLDEIQRLVLIIRIEEGKKLARKKSMMPKMPLSASEQADLDLYIDHLAEELKKLAQFRSKMPSVVNIAKKLPRI